jgi:spermidine/putrescine transport system permease protein
LAFWIGSERLFNVVDSGSFGDLWQNRQKSQQGVTLVKIKGMKLKLSWIYLTAVYLFLYLPIIVLVVCSFNTNKYGVSWQAGTLEWYRTLFSDDILIKAAQHSLFLALFSASIATVLGTLAAFGLHTYSFLGKPFFSSLMYIVVISPDIIMGISLLILFSLIGMPLGFFTLLLAHITFNLPFVMIIVFSRLSQLNQNLIFAAKDLGATEFQAFWNITLPALIPAIIAGWLLAFTLSLDDVVISFFVTGPDFQILPLILFSMARLGIKPEINALCALLFMVSLTVAFLSHVMRKEA